MGEEVRGPILLHWGLFVNRSLTYVHKLVAIQFTLVFRIKSWVKISKRHLDRGVWILQMIESCV